MGNPFCTLASTDFNNSGRSTSITAKQSQLSADIDSFCTKYGFYPDVPNQENEQIQHFQDSPESLFFQDFSSNPLSNSPTTFKNVKRADTTDMNSSRNHQVTQKLSTEQILALAGERFIHFSSQKLININLFMQYPYGFSVEDKQDVELAHLLLAAAEKVGNQQHERAIRLLINCQWISSNVGTPVQRAVFYFSEALMERINYEKGSLNNKPEHMDGCLKRNVPAFLAMHRELPFFQVVHFTAVQTILENISSKSIIHLIDFNILTGLHWAAFMQATSEQLRDKNNYLRITAIETVDKNSAEKTGDLLKSFASYLNLPFSYNLVFLSDIKDLKQDDLGIEPEEDVAILFPFMLRTLISKPTCLKNLMTITQKIKPSIIVVSEVEANHNSPSFVTRFIEALFYYGALFDSLEESMAGDDKNRIVIEAGPYREGIRNIVATEGYQRFTRSVTINVWRAFFARFGMQELELSSASLYQAYLTVNQFSSGKSCNLDVSTKCLLVGWKGTPLFSLSAWKFY